MKSRDENKALLDLSVERLQAYPLVKRKQLFLKGMAMAMARLKDRQEPPTKRAGAIRGACLHEGPEAKYRL